MTDLGSIAPSLAALGLLALLVGVRSVRMARGAPVSGARLIAYGAVYVVLHALALLADATLLPLYGYAVDAVAIAGAFAHAVP